MPNSMMQFTKRRLGELDAWQIKHASFSATILKQGAQLIEYQPTGETNWLWVSECATYKQDQAVRGGIPICWPIFGSLQANPSKVKNSLSGADLPQHGIARVSEWHLSSLQMSESEVEVHFQLPTTICGLQLMVCYVFREYGFSVKLTTLNTGATQQTFTQALHTYLPTENISLTKIAGFDNVSYHDSLTSTNVIQHGLIEFNTETDRIYQASPDIHLTTPSTEYHITSQGSQSTVIWNPWQEKANTTSQMRGEDYECMLCIETANALNDYVTLAANTNHTLSMTLNRQTR